MAGEVKPSRLFVLPPSTGLVDRPGKIANLQGSHGKDRRHAKQARAPRAQDRIAHLKEELNLTDDQVAKLKPVMQEEGKKLRELRSDTTLSREDKLSKVKTIHQDLAAKVKPILTTEQYSKWEKMQEGARKRRTQPQE